ncbi:DUF4180 domain-containing protein [Mucilaginibacter corticis]|uniref:DUF4180 domain-containing protein n=1 Tax=Mucilaginibacter corticis TaxID=2597670 RepID=UPI001FEC4066|nr:DUF4180 domain-containing protein [Mucilaginibacter corticis]
MILIKTPDDGGQLIADLHYHGFELIIIKVAQLDPDFFELETRLAGEVLQKCSNCRMRLVIVGDFTAIESKSLRDFIFESNKGKLVNFVGSSEEALSKGLTVYFARLTFLSTSTANSRSCSLSEANPKRKASFAR